MATSVEPNGLLGATAGRRLLSIGGWCVAYVVAGTTILIFGFHNTACYLVGTFNHLSDETM